MSSLRPLAAEPSKSRQGLPALRVPPARAPLSDVPHGKFLAIAAIGPALPRALAFCLDSSRSHTKNALTSGASPGRLVLPAFARCVASGSWCPNSVLSAALGGCIDVGITATCHRLGSTRSRRSARVLGAVGAVRRARASGAAFPLHGLFSALGRCGQCDGHQFTTSR